MTSGRSAARLGPAERAGALERMTAQELDVVVVGGGVVGAGIALDAATRGLDVGLVEARDFASGTSSRSSKLIHGGLRYLEQLNFELVREALQERALLLQRIAPHLVRPVPFLFPLTHYAWERPYVGAGVALYDTLGFATGVTRGVPGHRHLSRSRALRLSPALKKSAFTGAIQYWDAQVDDARFVMTTLRTAVTYGAHVVPRAQVVGFLREGERVTGVRVRDLECGEEFEVRARQVVNATGVWTDDIQELVGGRGQIHVRASKGIHLVVPRDRIHSLTGIILRTEKSVLFVIPWGRHWIVGTTDTEWTLDKSHPAASRTDIDYLLDHINAVLSVPLSHDDVEGVYAGLRPLLSGESDETSKLSREHVVAHPVPGLVMIMRRKIHDLPGDGQGRGRRRGARSRPAGAAIVHRPHPARGRRGLPGPVELQASHRPRLRAPRGQDRASAPALRLADRRAAGPDRRRSFAGLAAVRGRRLPAGRDRLRRHSRGRPPPQRRADPAHAHLH